MGTGEPGTSSGVPICPAGTDSGQQPELGVWEGPLPATASQSGNAENGSHVPCGEGNPPTHLRSVAAIDGLGATIE